MSLGGDVTQSPLSNSEGTLRIVPTSRKEVLEKKGVDVVVLGCIDFRFAVKHRHALRSEYGAQEADLVSIPGGAYAICRPRAWNACPFTPKFVPWFVMILWPVFRRAIWVASLVLTWFSLLLALQKHNASHIVISDHEDCGMCGVIDQIDFSGREDAERTFHIERLWEAHDRIAGWFPGVKVSLAFVHPDDKGHVQIVDLKLLPSSDPQSYV